MPLSSNPNSNIEIRNKSEYQISKIQNLFNALDRSNLVLVSDFEFHVSKLPRPHRFINIWIE